MRISHWCAAVSLSLAAVPALAGDAEKKAELNTDRPDFTESSVTVPRGRLQLESGLTWSDEPGGSEVLNGPEMLFRYGLFDKTELRLIPPDYFRVRGRGRASGWGDAAVGVKQQLGPVGGWDFALIAHATIPTEGRFSSGRMDPEVAFTWSRDLNDRFSLAGLIGFFWPTEGGDRNFTLVPTISLAYSLGGRWGTFLEYAAEFPESGGDIHLLHHG